MVQHKNHVSATREAIDQQACSARLTAHWNPDPRFQLQSFQGPDFDRLVFGIGGIPVCSWRSLRLCIEYIRINSTK